MIPKEQKQEAVTLFAEHDAPIKAGTHFVDLPPQLAHARVGVGTSERVRKFPEGRGDDVEVCQGEGTERPVEGLGRLDLHVLDFFRVGRFF